MKQIYFLFIYRLAVHNMHYVSNTLGIRDPIHKQKIALKAMDVVLFGPPRGKLQLGIFLLFQVLKNNVTILFLRSVNFPNIFHC